MIKILVTGDFHINEKDLEEISTQLNIILETILSEKVDIVCMLGDIFDTKKPNANEILTFIKFINEIPENVKIYIIAGNHEWINDKESALDWVPYIRKNVIFNHSNIDFSVSDFKIAMRHFDVSESKIGAENISLNSNKSINLFKKYDVVLLGHIHKQQIIRYTNPLALHPGSIIHLDFAERNDSKGFFILSINNKQTPILVRNINLSPIPMKQFEINSIDDFKLLDKESKNTKIKLIINLKDKYNLDYLNDITKLLNKYSKHFIKFKYEMIHNKNESDIPAEQKNLSINELLNLFYQKENVSKELQELINELVL